MRTPTRPHRFRPASSSISIACLLSLGALATGGFLPGSAAPAHAQAQPTGVAIDLPVQPLEAALHALSRQTGAVIAIDAQLAAGKTAPAVQGRYTPGEALQRLLAGSGLEAAQQANGSFVLRRSVSIEGRTLAEVKVTAAAERSGMTEGTGSYQATATNTATKLTLTPRETPQTVTVVTTQQMQDFGMTSVDDALEAVSGVFVYDRGNAGSFYISRGFQMEPQNDGMPTYYGISEYNLMPQIDNAFFDRVEVVQGASGLLTGAGEPGGTINLVRKRPTQSFQAEAEVQLASWDGRRIVGDVSGPLVESGSVRGRVVAVADNTKSFVDYAYRNRRALYAIVEADLTPSTTLDASVQYQKDTGLKDFGGLFAPDGSDPGFRRSAFWGDANGRTTRDYTMTTLGLTQSLPGDWQAKAVFMHRKTKVDIRRVGLIDGELDVATGDGLELLWTHSQTRDFSSNAVDVYASGPFHLLGRKHEAALGLSGSSLRLGSDYIDGGGIPINAYTFDPVALGDVPESDSFPSANKISQLGGYGVARFSLSDALKLITGLRVSNYKSEDPLTGRTRVKKSGVISPYAGLVYDLGPQTSVYASYSDIFTPQSAKSADGSTLKPVVGANYEVGIKGELLDKRLNVSAAVFRLEQTNLAVPDRSIPYDPTNACGGTCSIAVDKVVSQGIDLGVSGELSPGWNVAAGYTYTASEYASGEESGQRYNTNVPHHSLRLSTAYRLPGTGWTLGGNLTARNKIYYSETSWITGDPWTIRDGNLVLVGLMAKYQINPKAELTMTVSNLFDRHYRSTVDYLTNAAWGEPRRVAVNLKYRF